MQCSNYLQITNVTSHSSSRHHRANIKVSVTLSTVKVNEVKRLTFQLFGWWAPILGTPHIPQRIITAISTVCAQKITWSKITFMENWPAEQNNYRPYIRMVFHIWPTLWNSKYNFICTGKKWLREKHSQTIPVNSVEFIA